MRIQTWNFAHYDEIYNVRQTVSGFPFFVLTTLGLGQSCRYFPPATHDAGYYSVRTIYDVRDGCQDPWIDPWIGYTQVRGPGARALLDPTKALTALGSFSALEPDAARDIGYRDGWSATADHAPNL